MVRALAGKGRDAPSGVRSGASVRVSARDPSPEGGFQRMLASAAEGVLMTDGAGKVVYVNERAARAFGYAEAEMLGMTIDDLIPPADVDVRAQDDGAGPKSRRMQRGQELTGQRKDGAGFPIEVGVSWMDGAEGQLVVAFVTDISERKEADKKIRAYQAKLQTMAFESAVSEERERRRIATNLHDHIGQSLALAKMKLAVARDAIDGAPRAAVDAAAALVMQAIADVRTLTFDLSPPVLYDLGLKAALSWLADDIERRYGVNVEVSDDGNHPPLDDAAAGIVFRTVRELVLNVCKHAKTPTATITLGGDGAHVEIQVEDRGVGFDPESHAAAGVDGFGLFSVREQISRLGGTIAIDSAPREGTRVSLRVPALVTKDESGDER